MVMSVTTQIIFPYMSDARAPAMDVHMTPQDAGMARSFWLILSALLIGVDGYCMAAERTRVQVRPLVHSFVIHTVACLFGCVLEISAELDGASTGARCGTRLLCLCRLLSGRTVERSQWQRLWL